MQQIEIFEIPSPCVGVCQNNNKGYCRGCARSRQERFEWQTYSDAQKKEVIRLCNQRKARSRNRDFKKEATNTNSQLDLDF
ncbi:DUF1289 domain-containing protein [Paraferrimonas sp. SM1919]|uniref:DUF1289 domain-containing protein n=1 Tax=Paraferrimonas sp. SM1919 TaxID=2662263 RepID=UPI0013D8B8ED|nr:DUF1289 domain-containing protein [Paraferrimonas sp. SM1919]